MNSDISNQVSIFFDGDNCLLDQVLPYVYCGIRKHDGKIYIGARCGNVRNNISIKNDFGVKYFTSSKYVKFTDFNWEILYIGKDANDAFDFEGKLIDEYLLSGFLINRKGTKRFNTVGIPHTLETREKMSNQRKGKKRKPLSEQHKQSIRNSLKGQQLSEERKQKIRETSKGRMVSEETRKNLSNAGKGRIVSEETKKKISDTLLKKNNSDK